MDKEKVGSNRIEDVIAGEYEFCHEKVIGHGAFSVVYKGRKIKDKSFLVAIKSIARKSLIKNPALFMKEIKILQQVSALHNKHLVSMLAWQEGKTDVYVVLEYCNGGDLADYISNTTLSEETIRLFLLQLADAMKALRSLGIVHRDLKPQNILFSHDPAILKPRPHQLTLKLADFGFARILPEGAMAGTLCGSPMYMAPEVIMSQQYDGRADLWSIGTIVYQALTGNAPFTAPTPQALKMFYEKNSNPSPKIPSSTSPELVDFMIRLMKRNPTERMSFEEFFNHKFLQREKVVGDSPLRGDYPLPVFGSSPAAAKVPQKISSPIRNKLQIGSNPSKESIRSALSSSPEDDYVIVLRNGQIEQSNESLEKGNGLGATRTVQSPPTEANVSNSSPPRPCSLPLTSEPIPVPRRNNENRRNSGVAKKEEESYSLKSGTSVPRSAPINMKRQESKPDIDIDISSMSPPSVKFMIGTPPGGRRRSTSGSSYSETPPPNAWTVSPVSSSRIGGMSGVSNSPLRRSGTSPPVLSSALTRVPMLSSPNLSDNNNLVKGPIFTTRAMTLPEISEMGNLHSYYGDNDNSATFFAPELPEETLLGKEHNETLAKINFVLALSNCILSIAAQKSRPIISLVDSVMSNQTLSDPKTEQLVLLIRALQLLSSGLTLASKQIGDGHLKPSSSVKNVVAAMNSKFKQTLSECRQLNEDGIVSKLKSPEYTADAILYHHAIQMCQTAAMEELFDKNAQKASDCAQRYQTAQILLHGLSQQVNCPCDREKLIQYKVAVEKRLHVLQEKGFIYATDFS